MELSDLKPGDIVEYMHPYTRMQKKITDPDAGKYGTGRLVSIDKKGYLILENNIDDRWKISPSWIRWDMTEKRNKPKVLNTNKS